MLKYEFISKEWIVSPAARRIYRVSAVLSMVLFISIPVFRLNGIPELIVPMVRPLLFAGAIGAATTLVGMEFFLFRFDNSHPLKQIFWFCVMLFPLLGAALYCLVVYSRSDVFRIRDKSKDTFG